MDGEFLTPEQVFPPPVQKTGGYSNGAQIGPVKDGHTLLRYIEDGREYLDLHHPEHCYGRHGEGGVVFTRKHYISGSGDLYEWVGQGNHQEWGGICLVDYAECSWKSATEGWDLSKGLEEETHGLFIGDIYGDGMTKKTYEESLPLEQAVEVTWTSSWGYDPWNMEWDWEFSWWVE